MHQSISRWLALLTLCFAVHGCGEEPAKAPESNNEPSAPEAPQFAEVVIEIGNPRQYPERDGHTAVDALVGLIETRASEGDRVDQDFENPGQVRLIVKPPERADAVYTDLKDAFDQISREAVEKELSDQQTLIKTTAKDVQQYQKLMQRFQQGLAVEVEVNGKKLDRRKLDRLLTTTLASQIEAEKRVESLQKQIDRERYATLLRLK